MGLNISTPRFDYWITITSLVILFDAVWFRVSKNLYPKVFNDVHLLYGIGAWVLMGFALSLPEYRAWEDALFAGLLFGLVSYGIFNFTELAIRPDWRSIAPLVDTLWGMFVCTLSTLCAYFISIPFPLFWIVAIILFIVELGVILRNTRSSI
jgi:uncharacterized membrane protein